MKETSRKCIEALIVIVRLDQVQFVNLLLSISILF